MTAWKNVHIEKQLHCKINNYYIFQNPMTNEVSNFYFVNLKTIRLVKQVNNYKNLTNN